MNTKIYIIEGHNTEQITAREVQMCHACQNGEHDTIYTDLNADTMRCDCRCHILSRAKFLPDLDKWPFRRER